MRLWNVKEAAAALHLSSSFVYQLCAENRIPHLKIGTRLLFRSEALEAWVLAQEVPVGK